jgi:hypothetical protein
MRNSQRDAIQQSDLIVIGDLTSGEKARQDEVMNCRASIRVVRVLKGSMSAAGRDVSVHWQYLPRLDQPEDLTPEIGPVHAIWFLTRPGQGGPFEAMWAEVSQRTVGGYLVPIPEGEPQAPLAYPPNADYRSKLAGELAWAMQVLAVAGGDRLNVVNTVIEPSAGNRAGNRAGERADRDKTSRHWFTLASGNSAAPVDPLRAQFVSIASLFGELDPAEIREQSQYLAQRPEIHLRAVGLLGELRGNDANAILRMESILPQLSITPELFRLAAAATAIDIGGNRAAIQAIGRMSLSETHILSFDDGAVHQLARTNSPIAVPYLETMLLHPQPRIRTSAARGICTVFSTDSALRPIVDGSLIGICSFGTIAANRIGNHGSKFGDDGPNANALRAWLVSRAAEVRKVAGVDSPPAPGWFAGGSSVQ